MMRYAGRRHWSLHGLIRSRGRRADASPDGASLPAHDEGIAPPGDPARGLVIGICFAAVFWAIIVAVLWWVIH